MLLPSQLPAHRSDGLAIVYMPTVEAWYQWIEVHHTASKGEWIALYKKPSGIPSIDYRQALEEALCFGWVDSSIRKHDDWSYFQYFSTRKPKSNWSAVNKEKVKKLTEEERLLPAGLAMVDLAQRTGTWDALELVDARKEPEDLILALQQDEVA